MGPRRIGVTGGSGYLGARLLPALAAAGLEPVDLGRAAGVDLLHPATLAEAVAKAEATAGLDAVIHAAAANPGRAPDSFDVINRAAPAALAKRCEASGIRLVHVSTDSVLDGRGAPYPDDAPARPINAYGASKAAGEAAVLDACPGAVVVRTSLIYGLHAPDRATAGFLSVLRAGGRVALYRDVIRQPVWVEALALGLLRLATELSGTAGQLNLAGSQALDRASFARRLLARWAVQPESWGEAIEEVSAGEHLRDVPIDLRLLLTRATTLGLACPGVDEVLAGTAEPGGTAQR